MQLEISFFPKNTGFFFAFIDSFQMFGGYVVSNDFSYLIEASRNVNYSIMLKRNPFQRGFGFQMNFQNCLVENRKKCIPVFSIHDNCCRSSCYLFEVIFST